MSSNCYLCGAVPAPKPLDLKKSFTAHSSAACPESNNLCDRCDFSLNLRANYWNETKGKYSLLYARNWSWLYQGSKLISPVFEGEHDGFPVVTNLATRIEMRNWLLNPPDPPFTIAIAESGQKHILFLAKEGQSKDLFPVQFEIDTVWINRENLELDLAAFEQLLGMGATKTEVVTGDYKSAFLLKAISLPDFDSLESKIELIRGKRYLELLSHVAQPPEQQAIPEQIEKTILPQTEEIEQLTLF